MIEPHVCWWTRSSHDTSPIPQDGVLAERPMSVLWQELVAVEVLSRRLPTTHQEQVVTAKTSRIRNDEDSVHAHGKRHAPNVDGMPKGGVVSLPPDQHMRQAGSQEEETQKCTRRNKGQEIAVIPASDTVVEPHAVMVLGLDARVAHTAVMSSWRSPDVA